MDNALLNKSISLKRCIDRIHSIKIDDKYEFEMNYDKQDIIVLNVQRACELAIDMGNRVIRLKKLGVPQHSREVFELLEKNHIISAELSHKMRSMIGFRNIAVHDYQKLNIEIVISIVNNHLNDFVEYCNLLLTVKL
jgi:uncharacterized protein YutE (UPF0331/DUF86 family)